MYRFEKSDRVIVAMNAANKRGPIPRAEQPEPRTLAKQNSLKGDTRRTQRRVSVQSSIEKVRSVAEREDVGQLTALLHHITPEALRVAYFLLKKDAAPGVDEVVWRDYEVGLEDRVVDLHKRIHTGAYRARPSRQVGIPKEDGTERKLGIAALEDKIVQMAVVRMILYPIYEGAFAGFSYGFRPGRGAHQALDALTVAIEQRKVSWILDCDIRGFFDNVNKEKLVELLEKRIGDPRVIRLIRKWLNAGVMVNGVFETREKGTPQGAVISPVLANIYLHYALDVWIQEWRTTQARGEIYIVRYADDFVIGAQYKEDAEALLVALKERLGEFSLEIHPDKSRLLEFGRFAAQNRKRRGQRKPETFDFLGMTFYCSQTRKGKFAVRRKPIRKRMCRTLRNVKDKLWKMMHMKIHEQGEWLGTVLNGWMNYFAVPGSFRFIRIFRNRLIYVWYQILRRRSQRSGITLEKMYRLAEFYLPKVRICRPWPEI